MPATLEDLSHRIVEAVNTVFKDQLLRVWQNVAYRFDVCHATRGVHVECILP